LVYLPTQKGGGSPKCGVLTEYYLYPNMNKLALTQAASMNKRLDFYLSGKGAQSVG